MRFFHTCISRRKRKNFIHGILVEEDLVSDVDGIKGAIKNHFVKLFDTRPNLRIGLEGMGFNVIGEEENAKLVAPFSMEEIQKAVWECDSDKSPGPDGMNFGFVKQFWEVMQVDFLNCFAHFHATGRLVKGGNSSFIVFVPKKDNPQRVEEYRPISLIGCVYKILAKVLCNRLRLVLDPLISNNQSTFIQVRHILDSILVANEVAAELKDKRTRAFMFKVDFEKDYDSVRWDYI